MDRECFATYGREFEHTGQCNDVLRDGVVMPVIRGVGRRLLEKDCLRCDEFAFTNATTHHMRVSVGTSVETISADHISISLVTLGRHAILDLASIAGWEMLSRFNTFAVSART